MSSAAAASPALVTHGLTLKGASLSWAIAHRRKTIENRSTRLPTGWIALHTGVGKLPAARAVELAANCPGMPTEESLPHGCIIGAMRIDRACDVAGCAGTPHEASMASLAAWWALRRQARRTSVAWSSRRVSLRT